MYAGISYRPSTFFFPYIRIMLSKLHIQNYAIIDEVMIDFSQQLNIITGETGAGKSIIMGALGLILGNRADSNVAMDKQKKSFAEGSFNISHKKNIQQFLQANDLEADDELVIRREINPSGKSRAFINDTPVNLSLLNEVSSMLVDLHQQFDTLEIGASDFQREVLDALANNFANLEKYETVFQQLKTEQTLLAKMKEEKAQFNKEFDYNKFLFDELHEASLKENELEELETELKVLSHSEGIKAALTKAYFDLQESETPLTNQLKQVNQQLQQYSQMSPDLENVAKRIQSTQIELQDIADEIDRINEGVLFNQERIEQINDKMNLGYKLLKKHAVQTTNELLTIQQQLDEKLQSVLNIDENIAAKEKKVSKLFADANYLAKKITEQRNKQIAPLEKNVNGLLHKVGMPNAQLKVQMTTQDLQANGADAIEFLFDANKSGRFEPVRKVASGGELSRLMLSIKSLVAQSIDLPTMIFDEIDTGISGEAARQVGIILKNLSVQRQVICITHQPQIAGKADAHYFVYKEIKGDAIKTNIRMLNTDERITAIAKMLSGEKPTAAALENAREMVMN